MGIIIVIVSVLPFYDGVIPVLLITGEMMRRLLSSVISLEEQEEEEGEEVLILQIPPVLKV